MASKTETKPSEKKQSAPANASAAPAPSKNGSNTVAPQRKNPYGIPDYRAEVPNFTTYEEWVDGKLQYQVKGDLDAPVPAIKDSKYLTKEQSLEIYRYIGLCCVLKRLNQRPHLDPRLVAAPGSDVDGRA